MGFKPLSYHGNYLNFGTQFMKNTSIISAENDKIIVINGIL
jgi:hypothetical protein